MAFRMQAHQEPLVKVISIFQNIVFQSLKVVQAYLIGKLEPIGKVTPYIISEGCNCNEKLTSLEIQSIWFLFLYLEAVRCF